MGLEAKRQLFGRLDKIHAYDRFEQTAEGISAEELYARFRKAISDNYFSYQNKVLSWDKETMFKNAEEIAAVISVYRDLMEEYKPDAEEMRFFLQFADPLRVISQYGPFDNIDEAMFRLHNNREDLMAEFFEASPEVSADSLWKKLAKAQKGIGSRTSHEKSSRDTGARC